MPHDRITESGCNSDADRSIESARTCEAPGHSECGSHSGAKPEISSSKIGWGGPRPNSGGPRANSGGPRANSGGVRPGAGRPASVVVAPLEIRRPAIGDRWYVVQHKPRLDLLAINELHRSGFAVHFPKFVTQPGCLPRPLFPGYMFVAFDVEAPDWRRIPGLAGIHRLFSFAPERPCPMPVGYVEQLLAQAGQAGIIDASPKPVMAGDTVTIRSGAFADWVGLCHHADRHRVDVLLEFFGRDVIAELSRDQVDRADAQPNVCTKRMNNA